MQNIRQLSNSRTIDNFVAEKASNFNKIHHTSTKAPQTIQQESLGIHKNP